MKKLVAFIIFIFVYTSSFSQEVKDTTNTKKPKMNRWSIDFALGSSRGIKPYNEGYFSTENDVFLGELTLNSVNIGARYYLNKYVTFKSDVAFDRFTPRNNKSIDFDVAQYRLSVQSMFNLNSIFGINDTSKFKLQTHVGLNMASLKTIKSSEDQVIGSPDYILGLIYGFSPMYNITKKTGLFLDVSFINNFRQHHTWDGNVSDESNNLTGQMSSLSIGISYKLGNPINQENEEIKKLEESKNDELEKRLTDVETKLIDTDKDGVFDYLDQENNSLEGAIVDSKGVMVDKNNNNISDEIEKYLNNANTGISNNSTNTSITNQTLSDDYFKRSINERYIAVFFDYNDSKPTNASKAAINYVLTYLKANPNANLDVIGYSDEIGNSTANEILAQERADNVVNTLIKAGINSSRLISISGGENTSVDPNSAEARSLVRKVIFKIK